MLAEIRKIETKRDEAIKKTNYPKSHDERRAMTEKEKPKRRK
jgi:hypothetical protein